MAKPNQVPQRWLVIDAADQVVGRLAVQIANVLRGKHRPEYTPHIDTGEFVVVINAGKLRFTGKKMQTKEYHWYTRYPGGLKTATARDLIDTHPDRILRELETRRDVLGEFELNVAFRFGGVPYGIAERGLKLFATEVLPVLKSWRMQDTARAAE